MIGSAVSFDAACAHFVIPAKAGIQIFTLDAEELDPGLRGDDEKKTRGGPSR